MSGSSWQRWMTDTFEPLLEGREVWLTQTRRREEKGGNTGTAQSAVGQTFGQCSRRSSFVEDAQPEKTVEVKRQDRKEHWQVDTPEQVMEDNPRKTRKRQRSGGIKRAASSYNASTGIGAECVHPKVSLDVSEALCGEIVVFVMKLEQCGYWPVQNSTLLFFRFPKNVTSERPIALLPGNG